MSQIKKIFWISLVIKLVLAALIPLTADEAYYWVWSQHPQLSYYDHPAIVAWLFWLGQWIGFYGGMVRWPGVLLGQATLGVWLYLLKPGLDESQLKLWLWFALLSPLIGGAGFIITPDVPLLFFYALSLLLLLKLEKNPTVGMAAAFGLSIGLGFASKYMMVLFPFSLLLWMFFSKPARRLLFGKWVWILAGIVVGTFPVWFWNAHHHFISFRFQADHGLGRAWKPSWTYAYVMLQALLIFPPVIAAAISARKKLPAVFNWLAWTPIIFFFFTTYGGYAEANWPIAAYPVIFALAAAAYPKLKRGLNFTAAFWGLALASIAAIILIQPHWAHKTKFQEFHKFDRLEQAARGLKPLYARSYQMAAKMSFEMKRPVYKLRGMNRKDFYDYIPQSEPNGKSFYLAIQAGDPLPPAIAREGFRVTQAQTVLKKFAILRVERP